MIMSCFLLMITYDKIKPGSVFTVGTRGPKVQLCDLKSGSCSHILQGIFILFQTATTLSKQFNKKKRY